MAHEPKLDKDQNSGMERRMSLTKKKKIKISWARSKSGDGSLESKGI